MIAFILTIYHESIAQIEFCLSNLRVHYPKSPVVVINDGAERADLKELLAMLAEKQAFYIHDERLKTLEHGALWWARFFEVACMIGHSYTAKLDSDTLISGRIDLPHFEVSGRVYHMGLEAQHVQGGFQIFRQSFCARAIHEARRDEYKDPYFWHRGDAQVFINEGVMSTDYTLAKMLDEMGVMPHPHPQIDSRALPLKEGEEFRKNALITHPHKFD